LTQNAIADIQGGAGPSNIRPMDAPDGYETHFPDVGEARRLSVILDMDLHFTLYGYYQGRHFLSRLKDGINNVIFISPSHGKQCGIGEYGRYLSSQFSAMGEAVHVARTSSAVLDLDDAFLDGSLVIVNHGPGLFDGLNPRLSQGESTTQLVHNLDILGHEKGCIPIIIHHSLIDTNHHLLYSRQNQLLQSGITKVSFVSSGARHFFFPALELGISPVDVPPHNYTDDRDSRPEVIGFFGFYQYGGKDFDSLFHLAKELRGKIVGSVAVSTPFEADKLEKALDDAGVNHEIGHGWLTDEELIERLLEADYFYLPQNDYDHWNNSATARFVTNLDRPLFLPPHHPFLDMADGAIFSTKDDLPRIAAYMREPRHYDEAVKRVQAFRKRAQMSNTAKVLRHDVVEMLGEMSRTLLVGHNELSYERYLELGDDARKGFVAELGIGSDVVGGCKALYRTPSPRQFWRKHYELGDLIFSTLFESVHAIFIALCKRFPSLAEIEIVLDESATLNGEKLRRAFLLAMKNSGTTFNSHEIVLLRNGALVDWQIEMAPKQLEAFSAAKHTRQAVIAAEAETFEEESPPEITNVLELLILPAHVSMKRPASLDLSLLDLQWVCEAPSLVVRFDRLTRAFTDAGMNMAKSMVFDILQPAAINTLVWDYTVEDFVYFDGDMFLINAIRCIEKRDIFPIEAMVFQSFLTAYDKVQLLRHLLDRSGRKVRIVGLDTFEIETMPDDFGVFIQNMRDPLFGLIDRRNAYEIQRRHNERWWLTHHENTSKIWNETEQNMQKMVLIYTALDATVDNTMRNVLPFQRVSRFATQAGLFLHPMDLVVHCHQIGLNNWMSISALRKHPVALRNFHSIEEEGAWTNGRSGLICLSLGESGDDADDAPQFEAGVQLDAHFNGSQFLGPRTLKAVIHQFTKDHSQWSRTEAEMEVLDDSRVTMTVPCEMLRAGCNIVIELWLSASATPQESDMSSDERDIGTFVHRIGVFSTH
jgi:hypothetical protein